MPFAIAIDGPAAAGKGTIARAVAAHFQCPHLDTGLLYRAVGRKMMDGMDPTKAALTLSEDDLARDDLRNPDVAQAASKVAVIAEVVGPSSDSSILQPLVEPKTEEQDRFGDDDSVNETGNSFRPDDVHNDGGPRSKAGDGPKPECGH